jgi:hypothetical protein
MRPQAVSQSNPRKHFPETVRQSQCELLNRAASTPLLDARAATGQDNRPPAGRRHHVRAPRPRRHGAERGAQPPGVFRFEQKAKSLALYSCLIKGLWYSQVCTRISKHDGLWWVGAAVLGVIPVLTAGGSGHPSGASTCKATGCIRLPGPEVVDRFPGERWNIPAGDSISLSRRPCHIASAAAA